jgi:uracil-DNA glycosylase family protein
MSAGRDRELERLRREAAGCRRCDLWKRGTQTVFGAGPPQAALMLVGEQPGDQEDKAGEPFVGPAGTLLRQALEKAGINPAEVYLTNAVKHFKWIERGKRRIHERPNREEILACRTWLDQEVAAVKPRVLVALGATAASVVIGSAARVMRDRGKQFESSLAPFVTLTVHPSSILRSVDALSRKRAMAEFVRDLRTIAAQVRRAPGTP